MTGSAFVEGPRSVETGLRRWAYRSRARAPLESLLVISDILAVSDRNNRRDGITGGLVYDDGVFFQTLEGATSDLERLMGRLSADARHTDLQLVRVEPIATRLFTDWSMAAPRVSPAYAPLMRKAVEASRDNPGEAIRLLHRLAVEDSIHP